MKYLVYICSIIVICFLFVSPISAITGIGTCDNPYVITNPVELQFISSDLDAYFILGNDIDLTGIEWMPIGYDSAPFVGHLDGKNYTISNLFIDLPDESYVGLFRALGSGAVIKNINFYNPTVSAFDESGCLAGIIYTNFGTYEQMRIMNVNIYSGYISGCGNHMGGMIGCVYVYSDVCVSYCTLAYTKIQSDALPCFIVGSIRANSVMYIEHSLISDNLLIVLHRGCVDSRNVSSYEKKWFDSNELK